MGIDWQIETHDTIPSTQDILKDMARLGEAEGRVVQAYQQTKGTGRHGRPWISEKGNLYISLLLRPDCQARAVTQLSLMSALAVAGTIQAFMRAPEKMVLKWPNDVLIDGQKCAGILLETEIKQNGAVDWVVIGIGINLAKPPAGMGACVQDYSAQSIDLTAFRSVFLDNMAKAYQLWKTENFSVIREKWLELAMPKDTPVQVKIGTQIEHGYFHDLDAQGNMVIRDDEHRTKTISAGEVHFLNKDM